MKILHPDAPVIFLMGPTASGKTALAIEVYQSDRFEIISVDSAMVYREMDIGSAKPSAAELALAPHHLIDFIDPADAYSAASFCQDAKTLINQIHERGKTPLLVGGSMLYFRALQQGLADLPAADPQVRVQLADESAHKGVEAMHARLAKVDAKSAERLHATDTQRILRALEVHQLSGKSLSWWHQRQQLDALPNPLLSLALAPQERSSLHQRIAKRFELMLTEGLVDEVIRLYQRGDLSLTCPSIKSVGYRQIWQYLQGEMALEAAVEKAVIATRQLAKRQYTWLRSWPDVKWFDPFDESAYQAVKRQIMDFCG